MVQCNSSTKEMVINNTIIISITIFLYKHWHSATFEKLVISTWLGTSWLLVCKRFCWVLFRLLLCKTESVYQEVSKQAINNFRHCCSQYVYNETLQDELSTNWTNKTCLKVFKLLLNITQFFPQIVSNI